MFGGTRLFDPVLDQSLQSPKLCRREPELKLQGVNFDSQECEAGSGAFHFVWRRLASLAKSVEELQYPGNVDRAAMRAARQKVIEIMQQKMYSFDGRGPC